MGADRGRRADEPTAETCPIEAMAATHRHLRELCAQIDRLADAGKPLTGLAAQIRHDLQTTLPMHHADEEQALFPRLRARARAEDDIGRILARLESDHARWQADDADLIARLSLLEGGGPPGPDDRRVLHDRAASILRHVAAEDAIVLPLARALLTARDRAQVLGAMHQRRLAAPQHEKHHDPD